MPPKKEPQAAVALYNVEIMTADELKQYVFMLQAEIEQMRRDCSFFLRDRDNLHNFFNISQDELAVKNRQLMLKDVEMERLKVKFDEELRSKEQISKYIEHENNERMERQSLNSMVELKTEQTRHLDEERRLLQIIEEKDKEVESLRLYSEVAVKDMKEKGDNSLSEMNEYHGSLLENTVQGYVQMFLKARQDFRHEKNAEVNEALEGRIFGENAFDDACANYIEKMQSYFKEITWKDIATINELQKKIADLQLSSEKTKLHLRTALQENHDLRQAKLRVTPSKSLPVKTSKGDYTPVDKMATDFKKSLKKINELDYANHVLGEKLRLVTSERDKLRNQFIAGLRKVRQKAELKALFLENKLRSIYNDKTTESSGISEITPGDQELTSSLTTASNFSATSVTDASANDKTNNATILNVRLQNSDKMFVPPQDLRDEKPRK